MIEKFYEYDKMIKSMFLLEYLKEYLVLKNTCYFIFVK